MLTDEYVLTDQDRAAIKAALDDLVRKRGTLGGGRAMDEAIFSAGLRLGIERGDRQGQERMRERAAQLLIAKGQTDIAIAIRALKVE